MDAQAYLIKHGWSGPGNPLNPNQRPGLHGGLGLTRPILVARKSNNHGVGKKTTKDASNQWWLRGFEDALKGVGDDSFEANSARQSNALTSELYRHFVRGTGLAGTLDLKKETTEEKSATSVGPCKKRKREEEKEEKEEKAARKEGRTARRAQKAIKKEQKAARKEARRVKRTVKEEQKEARRAEKAIAREARKTTTVTNVEEVEDYPTPVSLDQEPESKEDTEVARPREKKAKKTADGGDSKKKSKKIKA